MQPIDGNLVTGSIENHPESFRMVGSLRRALLVYAPPFFMGLILIYFFLATPLNAGHLLPLLLLIPVYVLAFADLILWLWRGVRIVELDSTGLNLRRVRSLRPMRIDSNQITGVYVTRSLDRTTVHILLRGASMKRFLGINMYSGPRIRMTIEPFDRKEFSEFARRMKDFRRIAEKQSA